MFNFVFLFISEWNCKCVITILYKKWFL